eukprot:11551051-Karenia_brevis.AAC.1
MRAEEEFEERKEGRGEIPDAVVEDEDVISVEYSIQMKEMLKEVSLPGDTTAEAKLQPLTL